MTISSQNSSVNIEVISASPAQKPILANLLELYAYDFSEFIDLKLGADGRFGYKDLPLYWEDENRYPFIVMMDARLAGFVFVRRGSEVSADENVWDMAEFFILRGYRRRGIGMKIAHEIWKSFPGQWEVRVMDQNQKAGDFWQKAIHTFIGKRIDPIVLSKNGRRWNVFSFKSM
jgi:predicted acetyltransferase